MFYHVYVVVQFYPWFKFYLLLIQDHYQTLPSKQTKIKSKPRKIKLNHNIQCTCMHGLYMYALVLHVCISSTCMHGLYMYALVVQVCMGCTCMH